ncbi:MAG: DUF3810 domain-containing protein [Oscillospiraceae bacterium]|jgi:hypothetical protein|nr:DUF3810 domain-containing protein [Oscillospiraceae bacterium]
MLGLLPWLIAALGVKIARAHPDWVDALFAERWYPFLVKNITIMKNAALPVAPILTALAAAWCVVGLVAAAARSLKSGRCGPILKAMYRRAVAAGCAYLLLYALWGAQYSRSPITPSAVSASARDTAVSAMASTAFSTDNSLARQCEEWIRQANWLYPLVRASSVNRSKSPEDILARVPSNFERARSALPHAINVAIPTPKPLGFDALFSSLLIEGLYFPFTFEALVNTSIPEIDLPFVACHETAHALGYAREEEANLVAAIVCAESPDPVFRYSGVMSSLRYGLSALAARDIGAYWPLLDQMDSNVRADFINRQQYWQQRQATPLAKLAARANDLFLMKAGGEADGAQSYGNVVELLKGWDKE